jgi:hypothetical protein
MSLVRGAHLVGGLAAPDAETAMTQAASVLGRHLARLTDGETGERAQWIWWQIDKLTALPGIRMGEPHVNPATGNPDYSVFPGLDVDEGIRISTGALGYASAAISSYAIFERLRARRVIPAGVRFQVSLPTPYASVISWVNTGSQTRFFAAYKGELFAELAAIAAAIPAADLAVQWDVAVEVGVLEGVFHPDPGFETFDRIVAELVDAVRAVPESVQVGLHLCYGDYKHRHFVAPTDLSLLVNLADAVDERANLDFVHMPVDRENGLAPGYFAPLARLRPGPALALGVIDYENDSERIDRLVTAASAAGRPFAVATECGMARLGERGEPVTLGDLLAQHARVADRIR